MSHPVNTYDGSLILRGGEPSEPFVKQMRQAMNAAQKIADAEDAIPADQVGALDRIADFAEELKYRIFDAIPGLDLALAGAIPGFECGCGGDAWPGREDE